MVYDVARLLGPALGGALVAAVGEGWCFLYNALSYAVLLIVLLFLRGTIDPHPPRGTLVAALREGVGFATHRGAIRTILLVLAVFCFAAASYQVLLPIVAVHRFGGGPYVYGLMVASGAFGSLCGAVAFFLVKSPLPPRASIVVGALTFGCGLMFFSASRSLLIAMPVLVLVGFGVMMFMNSCNAALIAATPDDKRGRVMSLFTLSLVGSVPLGSLVSGWIGSAIGAGFTLFGAGAVCVGAAVVFALSSD
jgi:predicted MFS family arabinose efflux permease